MPVSSDPPSSIDELLRTAGVVLARCAEGLDEPGEAEEVARLIAEHRAGVR